MKLGKHPARSDHRTIKLLAVMPKLPAPPSLVIRSSSFTGIWGMMGNDVLGDCTIAGLGHAEQTITSNCPGVQVITPSLAAVEDLYSKACGYVAGDSSTDNGGNELDVLNYVRKNGLFGVDQIIGYADTDPRDILRVKQGIAFYGGAYIGLSLPNSVVSGDLLTSPWQGRTDRPNPENGHAVWVLDYNEDGLWCITWGSLKFMSWDFWLRYCDETHIIFFKNWLAQYGNLPEASQAMANALEAVTG